MKVKSILILMCFTFMQSYNAAPAQSQMDLSRLPLDVLVETVIHGINQAGSLREAWEFIQKLSLTNRAFASLIIGDTPVVTAFVDALSEQVKKIEDPTKKLFDLVKTEKIGDVAAKLVMRALLKTANKDWQNEQGDTALIIAAREGHEGMVRELIKARADKDKQNEKGWTALIEAAFNGREGIVRELVKAGADKDKQDENGQTALMFAVYFGREGIVRELINAGADKDKQNENGRTALMSAAFNGREGIVRELINAGADKDKQDENGQTALMFAVLNDQLGAAKELINAGADKDKQDNDGGTALMTAAIRSQEVRRGPIQENMVKMLLLAGANPLVTDNRGENAYDITSNIVVRKLIQEAIVEQQTQALKN